MKNALLNFSIALAISILSTACAKGSSSGGSASSPAATTATTCSAGNLYSTQYGCQPQCGPSSIWYNNQCQSVGTSTGTGSGDYCQSICPSGYVLAGHGTACLPKGNCGPCQGSYNGQCYQGDGAGYSQQWPQQNY